VVHRAAHGKKEVLQHRIRIVTVWRTYRASASALADEGLELRATVQVPSGSGSGQARGPPSRGKAPDSSARVPGRRRGQAEREPEPERAPSQKAGARARSTGQQRAERPRRGAGATARGTPFRGNPP